jgi:type II secretory pathway component PulM
MIPDSVIQRLEEAAQVEQRLYRKRIWLALTGIVTGGTLLLLASFFTIRLERRAERAHQEVRQLENQKGELVGQIKEAVKKKEEADKAATKAIQKKTELETDLRQTESELGNVEKQRNESAQASAEPGPSPGELTAAKRKEIEELIEKLYASTPTARGRAYNELMKKFRYQPFVIEAVINRARKELNKPRPDRDLDGLYNSLVTLTDLSRKIIQAPSHKDQIAAFAKEVAIEMPGLQKRADILIRWLNTPP